MKRYIKVNGCKLPVNMADMAFLKRLANAQAALQAARTAADEFPPDTDPQGQYKWMEDHVFATCAFFDALYGEGTAERIFKRTNIVTVYWQAVQDFGDGIEKLNRAFCSRYGIR